MRRRLRSEAGVALTVAIFTLAVIALFSALLASSAVHLGDTSNRDRDQKRALGAAEAGLNTALHRVNGLTSPLTNLGCLTDVQVGVLATAVNYPIANTSVKVKAGQCPGAQGRVGNGAEWIYFITLLNNGQHCDQQYTSQTQVNNLLSLSAGGISVLRRCITSFGVVDDTVRRVQREIYSEFRLFDGLIGTNSVKLLNGANAGTSHVGANGYVQMDAGSLFGGQIQVQDGADTTDPAPGGIHATGTWGITSRPEPWIADPITVSDTSVAATPTCVLLCNAFVSPRRLTVSTGKTVTMSGGTYNLCEFNVSGGTLAITGTVKIFLDSDGPCAGSNGQGKLTINGGLVNTTGVVSASNLQIYSEGNSATSNAITIQGGSTTQANLTLFAPNADVTIQKTGILTGPTIKGSVTAKNITIGNSVTFVGDPLLDILSPFQQIAGDWKPGRWSECQSRPTVADDPHSGCVN